MRDAIRYWPHPTHIARHTCRIKPSNTNILVKDHKNTIQIFKAQSIHPSSTSIPPPFGLRCPSHVNHYLQQDLWKYSSSQEKQTYPELKKKVMHLQTDRRVLYMTASTTEMQATSGSNHRNSPQICPQQNEFGRTLNQETTFEHAQLERQYLLVANLMGCEAQLGILTATFSLYSGLWTWLGLAKSVTQQSSCNFELHEVAQERDFCSQCTVNEDTSPCVIGPEYTMLTQHQALCGNIHQQ